MTLILGFLTNGYAVLVSDRRLAWSDNRRPPEDSDTKTFNMYGHFLMGFTGIARFGGHRMERWVAEALGGVEPREYNLKLRNALIEEFRRLPPRYRDIRQAFLSVGFLKNSETGRTRAAKALVSNSLDSEEKWSTKVPVSKFEAVAEPLGNRRQLFTAVGYPMKRDLIRQANDLLRKISQQYPDDPLPAAQILVQCLRYTADVSDNLDGSNAMVATLPSHIVPAPYIEMPMTSSGVDAKNKPLAFYVRKEAKTVDEAEFYQPALIRTDCSIIEGAADPERLPPRPEGF
jgi:hypothetical protein